MKSRMRQAGFITFVVSASPLQEGKGMHSWWKKYKVLANLTPEIKLFEKWMKEQGRSVNHAFLS